MNANLPNNHEDRIKRALLSLDGLSIGDGFGQRFFDTSMALLFLHKRQPPLTPWSYTDDTEMALALVEVLAEYGQINQDALASQFATRFECEPNRGYGAGAHRLLAQLVNGADWQTESIAMFDGQGSLGNGGAMRVTPLGAYFADDPDETLIKQAALSAEVTHAHPEGQAGAIAVAAAAAWACRNDQATPINPLDIINFTIELTPSSATREGLITAVNLDLQYDVETAVNALGNGTKITAQDTVPLCIWLAAANLNDFQQAMWETVSAGGDRDTNAAIVGGIVALAVGHDAIPPQWRSSRENLLYGPTTRKLLVEDDL